MLMDHLKQQDNMIKYISITLLVFIISCKEKKDTGKTNNIKFSNEKITIEPKINCFKKSDSIKILKILKIFEENCKKDKHISSMYTEAFKRNFRKFPCDLFNIALNNNANPYFEIENQSDECDKLAVNYNYTITFIDDGDVYTSESSFILYFIKNDNSTILLEGFGAAG